MQKVKSKKQKKKSNDKKSNKVKLLISNEKGQKGYKSNGKKS